jgi:hypothetical protein
MVEIVDFSTFSLESAAAVFIICLAVKILRMKISTTSGCCGEHFSVTTESPGTETPLEV